MSTQSKCQTCGRKIPTTGGKLSSIEFRRYVNDINTFDKLISSKEYIGKFVYSKFRLTKHVDSFLEEFEREINYIDPTILEFNDEELRRIKIWILNYVDQTKGTLLEDNPESPLYNFLHSEYSEIDEPFHEFYDKYASNVNNPLNKNHVSRALIALGLKPTVRKIKYDGKSKCVVFLYATKEELSEIFRKNGR
jgi:hypothetical protein